MWGRYVQALTQPHCLSGITWMLKCSSTTRGLQLIFKAKEPGFWNVQFNRREHWCDAEATLQSIIFTCLRMLVLH